MIVVWAAAGAFMVLGAFAVVWALLELLWVRPARRRNFR